MTKAEYITYNHNRDEIIRQNKGRRIHGLSSLPVPPGIADPAPSEVWTPARFHQYFRTGK